MFRQKHIKLIEGNKIGKCKASIEVERDNYEKLGYHPNFLKYYGTRDNCIILEYIPDSMTLEDMFGSDPDNFKDIVYQSFTALDYLHGKGLSHGDLGNAKNVLYDDMNNRIVIIDLEGSPLTKDTKDEVYWDNRDLAFILWIVLDGDVSEDIYDAMADSDYSKLIIHIVNNKNKYAYDKLEAIDILISRLTNISRR